jgi:RNA polymerase sigma-70 factor (ECF subfamily)
MPAGILEQTEQTLRSPAAIAQLLVESYREFSSFLEQEVGGRVVSAEILQDAFVLGMHKLDLVHPEESTVDWFYRLLRHAVIDQPRHSGLLDHKLAAFRTELAQKLQPSVALRAAIQRWVNALAATLEPEQVALLRSTELDAADVTGLLEQSAGALNAAAPSVASASAALRRQVINACGTCAVHGAWNCTCGSALTRYGAVDSK